MRLIPAIDLLDGEVVRLRQGDFSKRTRYSTDPVGLAQDWKVQGASTLHVVDLNAARDDARNNRAVVESLASIPDLEVQCGGGIRSVDDVVSLLDAGARRVVIGSLAVTRQDDVLRWLHRFGPERIVLALDVRIDASGEPMPLTRGWLDDSASSLWSLLETYAAAGFVHLLCTDVSRDGMLSGPNVTLYREILSRFPGVSLQASGGICGADDIRTLNAAGVPGAILGRALLEARVSLTHALDATA